jgi:hypothetical protein
MAFCNFILERELSAYRFVGGKISPLTAEEEIAELDKALEETDSIDQLMFSLRAIRR